MRHLLARAAARLDAFVLRVHADEVGRCRVCRTPYPCRPAIKSMVRTALTRHLR